MIKVAEGSEPSNEDKLLAGKYKTEEDLNKGIQELVKKLGPENAYKFLEKQMGSKGQDKKDDQKETITATTYQEAEEVVNKLGLDFDEFTQEFVTKGELSEASYKKLAEVGIPKSVVDAYIEGQRVLLEQQANQVFSVVGGKEQYQELIKWAADNLTDSEIEAFNASVGGSVQQAVLAVEGLYAKYLKANGTPPKLIEQTESSGVSMSERFESIEQLTEAMADPRYKNDPAYRDKVMRKLKNSNIF